MAQDQSLSPTFRKCYGDGESSFTVPRSFRILILTEASPVVILLFGEFDEALVPCGRGGAVLWLWGSKTSAKDCAIYVALT